MAQSNRTFTSDVNAFTLGGTSYITQFKDATVTRKFDVKENRAAKDAGFYGVSTFEDSEFTVKIAAENTGVLLQYAGQRLTFTFKDSSTGLTYSGTGIVPQAVHQFGENAGQDETITVRCGVLTHA